ncbi:MAG: RDD family protein [Verrucomicrobiota bacterium]
MTLSGAEPPASAGLSTSTALIVAPPVAIPSDAALLPRVGFWRRFCATMLDFLLVGGLTIHLVGPLFLALWPAYFIAMWAWKGSTIGGIIMRIKVVRVDGQPVDFAVALVRSLSSFFSAFVLFLGFFWAGWDRERQAWHDKIAGTIVVKVPPGVPVI